jgi:hypothetical protein
VDREYLRFQHELLKDPLKQQRFVANLQLKILRDAMRYNSKIACVIAWDKGHLDNLTLHVTRDQVPLNTFILACAWASFSSLFLPKSHFQLSNTNIGLGSRLV